MAGAADAPAWLQASLGELGISGPFRNFRSLSGGCINQAYALETGAGPVFVKANSTAPGDFFIRESEGLQTLALRGSPLRIPKALGHAAPPQGPALLVLEYLEPAPASDAIWERLGRGLADLHRKTSERFGFDQGNYLGATPQENGWMENWGEFFAARRIEPLVRTLSESGALSKAACKAYGQLIEKIPGLLSHQPHPALIHGDLWSGNFLASSQGPALVDPAVYFADREAEWAMMGLFGGFPGSVFSAYQEANPLPAGWKERLPLYQLYHLLNHQLLFGGSYGEQALAVARQYL